MGANSKIEWCHHTFNPWVGCTKVSAACDHCYAESWAKRSGHPELWSGERRRTSAANWKEPIKWNKRAGEAGMRYRVFCASLADVFDNQVPEEWRVDLLALIADTPNLDWLLLTKRPQNIKKLVSVSESIQHGYTTWLWPNVWLGTTVENQEEADRRIPHLLSVPARVHFLSCEPLLGPVDLSNFLWGPAQPCPDCPRDIDCDCYCYTRKEKGGPSIDWVIAGGESGSGARPPHPEWFRTLRDQCQDTGVPFHFKQWGEWREAKSGDVFNTAKGNDGKPPAFIIDPDDGTVHCFMPEKTNRLYRAVLRVGKKAAGHLLDGVEHNAFPDSLP